MFTINGYTCYVYDYSQECIIIQAETKKHYIFGQHSYYTYSVFYYSISRVQV
jgi:hypothetical protein